jgi:hypothetical protein
MAIEVDDLAKAKESKPDFSKDLKVDDTSSTTTGKIVIDIRTCKRHRHDREKLFSLATH